MPDRRALICVKTSCPSGVILGTISDAHDRDPMGAGPVGMLQGSGASTLAARRRGARPRRECAFGVRSAFESPAEFAAETLA
jgi:hypothetical protein